MDVRVGCEFVFESDAAAPSVFQVQPHRSAGNILRSEVWRFSPALEARDYHDSFDNSCHRVEIPEGNLTARYDAVVEVSGDPERQDPGVAQVPVGELPPEVLHFTLPSRYCLSDVLSGAAIDLFDALEPGWGQVQSVCDWVHEHIAYSIGSSTPLTDATHVYMARQGVCRDLTHLAISFCRALNYPARYVFGYLPLLGSPLPEEGMDFAAWMEVYLDGGWYTFDPRNNQPRAGRVLIGRGRDAVDVAMVTSAGSPRLLSMNVWADA